MSEPRFESADAFLTALTHELVQHGTKSDKIDSFRCAAADNPEWNLLAETAIDLRDSYERHRQAKKHRNTWQGSFSSGGAARASGRVVAIARRSIKATGAFMSGIALMCLVWAGSSFYKPEPVGATVANGDSTPQTSAVADRSLPSTDSPPLTSIVGLASPVNGGNGDKRRITRERWAEIKERLDQRIEKQGWMEPAVVVQTLIDTPVHAPHEVSLQPAKVAPAVNTHPE